MIQQIFSILIKILNRLLVKIMLDKNLIVLCSNHGIDIDLGITIKAIRYIQRIKDINRYCLDWDYFESENGN